MGLATPVLQFTGQGFIQAGGAEPPFSAPAAEPSFPRWLGWWAIASGTILVAARAVWTTPFWFSGYALFWLWALVFCVRLPRAPAIRPTQAI
jgi:hypothetical protein